MTRMGETAFGAVVILAALGLFVISGDIRDFTNSQIDAAFLPRIAAGLLLILGAATVLNGWKLPKPTAPKNKTHEVKKSSGLPFVLASMGLMTAYVALLDSVGFVICSVVYVFCQILLLRKQASKRWMTFVVVSLVVPVVAYGLFVYVFEVMVPAGLLD